MKLECSNACKQSHINIYNSDKNVSFFFYYSIFASWILHYVHPGLIIWYWS